MKENLTEKINDTLRNSWRRGAGVAVASLILATTGAGCVSPTEVNKTLLTATAPGQISATASDFVTVSPEHSVTAELPTDVISATQTGGDQIATPTPETTVTSELKTGIDGLEGLFMFGPEGTVSFGNMTNRIDKKIVDALGIKSVEAENKVTENIYKVTMVYFAWELATQGDSTDPKLTIFKNLTVDDLNSLEKVLAVYEQNKSLGENGFDYTFNFGKNNIKIVDPTLTDRPDKITGKVEKIQCSELYDYKEFEQLIDYLNKNKIDYTTSNIPNMNTMVIFFNKEGRLEIYPVLSSYYRDMGTKLLGNKELTGEVFSTSPGYAMIAGQYAIGEQFPKRGYTVATGVMNRDLYTYDDNWNDSVYLFTYWKFR